MTLLTRQAATAIPNAGILRVDLSLATPPVFQEVGGGQVVRVSWHHHPRHPLLTTVDTRLWMSHHKVTENLEENPVKDFAVKPLDAEGGKTAWGSGGWLAYIT